MHSSIDISLCQYLLGFFKYFLTNNRFMMVTNIKFIFLSEIFQPSF